MHLTLIWQTINSIGLLQNPQILNLVTLLNRSVKQTLSSPSRFRAPTLQTGQLKLIYQTIFLKDNFVFKHEKRYSNRYKVISKTKLLSIFSTFHAFNSSFATAKSTPHPEHKLMFTVSHLGEVKFVNITKAYQRWVNVYHLLLNLFLQKAEFMVFGSILLREEICAINWSMNNMDYKFFKTAVPYFFFKDTSYGLNVANYFFRKLYHRGPKLLFLVDLRNLEKTLHFLRTENFYIIAPVPYSMNPWLVSYPIPVFINNYFGQWFFLKFTSFIQQRAYREKFNFDYNLWKL